MTGRTWTTCGRERCCRGTSPPCAPPASASPFRPARALPLSTARDSATAPRASHPAATGGCCGAPRPAGRGSSRWETRWRCRCRPLGRRGLQRHVVCVEGEGGMRGRHRVSHDGGAGAALCGARGSCVRRVRVGGASGAGSRVGHPSPFWQVTRVDKLARFQVQACVAPPGAVLSRRLRTAAEVYADWQRAAPPRPEDDRVKPRPIPYSPKVSSRWIRERPLRKPRRNRRPPETGTGNGEQG